MKYLLALLLVLTIPTAAYADAIENGDFDGPIGLAPANPWLTTGDVVVWPDNADPGANSQIVRIGPGVGGEATLSQTFDCGGSDPTTVCTVTFYILWFPSTADPGNDELFEIRDGGPAGSLVYSLTSAETVPVWTPLSLNFGPCGPQTLWIGVIDPVVDGIESTASVDFVSCSCDGPVPARESTWGKVKSLYR